MDFKGKGRLWKVICQGYRNLDQNKIREKKRLKMEEKEVGIDKCKVHMEIGEKWVSHMPMKKIKDWKMRHN